MLAGLKRDVAIGALCASLSILDLTSYFSKLDPIQTDMLRTNIDFVLDNAQISSHRRERNKSTSHLLKTSAIYAKTKDNVLYEQFMNERQITYEDITTRGNFSLPWVKELEEKVSQSSEVYIDANQVNYIGFRDDTVPLERAARKLDRLVSDNKANPKDLWSGITLGLFSLYFLFIKKPNVERKEV